MSDGRKSIAGTREVERERELLLRDAASHGPYLWTADDVDGALRWLAPSYREEEVGDDVSVDLPSQQRKERQQKEVEGVDDDVGRRRGGGESRTCPPDDGEPQSSSDGVRRRQRALLRSLLTSRGMLERRHHHGHHRRGKGDDEGEGGRGGPAAPSAGAARMERELRRRRHRMREHLHFVRAVARGYRGLDAESASSALACDGSGDIDGDGCSDGGGASKKDTTGSGDPKDDVSSALAAKTKSSPLKRDLLVASLSRLATGRMYRAAAATEIFDEADEQCRDAAEEEAGYFSHPDTAVRRAYAVQLYGRLEELLTPGGGEAEEDRGRGGRRRRPDTTSTSGEAEQFLRKLEHLARRDVRVREAQFLVLLEPARRLMASAGGGGVRGHGGNKASGGGARAVPMGDVDEACWSSVPCRLLCDSILGPAAGADGSVRDGDRPGRSRKRRRDAANADDVVGTDRLGEGGYDWPFLLPAPLLRAACRCHLPVAEACVSRLLDVAAGDAALVEDEGDDEDDPGAVADRVVAAAAAAAASPSAPVSVSVSTSLRPSAGGGRRLGPPPEAKVVARRKSRDALSRLSSLVVTPLSSHDDDGAGRLSLLVRETIEGEILALAGAGDGNAGEGCDGDAVEGPPRRRRRRRRRVLALGEVLDRLFPSTGGFVGRPVLPDPGNEGGPAGGSL